MPNLKSSKKDVRRIKKRRERNAQQKSTIRTYAKNILKAIKANNKEEAQTLYNKFASLVDKAAKKNLIHKKNADRKKSRIAQKIATLQKVAA
ncbi:MAG: 30S ribosomal protein S20 [Leptospiraceae bacterium]|nr:30S ribosomal protein S20 [Leptospiraceae bacterium]